MSFLFYIIPFLVLTVLVEAEWIGLATIALIASSIIMTSIHYLTVINWAQANFTHVLACASIYLLIGVVWSFVRWAIFLLNFRKKFREAKRTFLQKKNLPLDAPIPVDMMFDFKKETAPDFSSLGYNSPWTTPPVASNNKSRIIAWMSFWPCSILGYFLNDPVKRFFTMIWSMLKNSYQKMTDLILSDVEFQDRKE